MVAVVVSQAVNHSSDGSLHQVDPRFFGQDDALEPDATTGK